MSTLRLGGSGRLTLVGAALSSLVACGGQQPNSGTISAAGTSTSAGTGGMVGTAGTMSTPAVSGQGQGGNGLELVPQGGSTSEGSGGSAGVGGGCAATFVEAKGQQLAMFIMLDQSRSMDEVVDEATMTTRWTAVTSALGAFMMNPAAAAVPVGLQYFGLPAAQQPGEQPGGGRMNSSCTISDYAKADVPIAPLATNAAPIAASIALHAPLTNTPTLPAVQGGIQFVAGYAAEHPEYKVVLVLATDGEPSGCGSDVDSVSAAAAAGLTGMPSVETYVIGVGDNLANLNAIAASGGTHQAFLVSDANVQQDLITALTAIQGGVLPCQYAVPAPTMGKALDFGKVNVQYTTGAGMLQEFHKVATIADCTPGGNLWYYDDNKAPKQILLCPDTCKAVTGDPTANVNIVLDCRQTVVE